MTAVCLRLFNLSTFFFFTDLRFHALSCLTINFHIFQRDFMLQTEIKQRIPALKLFWGKVCYLHLYSDPWVNTMRSDNLLQIQQIPLGESKFLSNLNCFPIPVEEKYQHSMILLPPCFKLGIVCLDWCAPFSATSNILQLHQQIRLISATSSLPVCSWGKTAFLGPAF